MNWNDLKYLVAVADTGSTIAAARAVGSDQSTVARRLAALSRTLGRPLTVRTASGYALTPFGTDLLPEARAIARAAAQIVDKAAGQRIRVTCPEPVVARLIPLVELFHVAHPGWQVEFVTSDRYLDLRRGDADVAFRSGDTDADLFGRKVADSIWSVYASADYVARYGAAATAGDLSEHRIVTLDDSLAGHRVVTWLAAAAPDARVASRAGSILGLFQAVRAGLGIAPLPAGLADEDPSLVKLFGPVPELRRAWRLLTTPALRREPRIDAFFRFVRQEQAALQRILA